MRPIERMAMGGACVTPALAPSSAPGTLDDICDRILAAARAAREIGHKLHEHADAVHGPMPETANKDETRDRANGAIPRIYEALQTLDHAQAYMTEAAGRNATLA
jgi:hypothetical protein